MKSKASNRFPLLIMNVQCKRVPQKIWKLMASLKEKKDIKFSFGNDHETRIIDYWVNLSDKNCVELY